MWIDFEWFIGDYLVCFGYDIEINILDVFEGYLGFEGKFVYLCDGIFGVELDNGLMFFEGVIEYVEECICMVDGSFEIENSVFYIED